MQYEGLQDNYQVLQEKLNTGREKYKRAALLMTEFLYDILTDRENILTDTSKDMELKLYLDRVRETPLDDLDQEDKRKLVFILLKQLQPYLSASNLSTNPKPHMQVGGGDDLNEILDNINVKQESV